MSAFLVLFVFLPWFWKLLLLNLLSALINYFSDTYLDHLFLLKRVFFLPVKIKKGKPPLNHLNIFLLLSSSFFLRVFQSELNRKHLNTLDLTSDYQHGFRKNRSTSNHLSLLSDTLFRWIFCCVSIHIENLQLRLGPRTKLWVLNFPLLVFVLHSVTSLISSPFYSSSYRQTPFIL